MILNHFGWLFLTVKCRRESNEMPYFDASTMPCEHFLSTIYACRCVFEHLESSAKSINVGQRIIVKLIEK